MIIFPQPKFLVLIFLERGIIPEKIEKSIQSAGLSENQGLEILVGNAHPTSEFYNEFR